MQIKAKAIEEQIKKKNFEKKISVKKQYWLEKDFNSKKKKTFRKKINPILSRLLSSRSVEANNVEDYLNPKIKNILPDPYILHDMEIATNRIVEIIKEKKK